MKSTVCVAVVVICCSTLIIVADSKPHDGGRTFSIDYNNNTFLKDGKPYRYISGSIHYMRVPFYYWKDRLMKMKAAGLNAIQTYITWNAHEPRQGWYNFEGQQDLVQFLQTAQSVGLDVLLRAGPYICGEWEYGGFPPWILKNNGSIVVRSMDPGYLEPVDQWFSVLLPKIKPLLYQNGGPVLMVQFENEYGSYFTCSQDYLQHLLTLFKKYLGDDTVFYTTDGASASLLKCGATDGAYATVDFGPGGDVKTIFETQRTKEPKGPLVNSEYYTGWLDHWGGPHAHGDPKTVANYLDQILSLGANINMYMMHGGTNFAYWNGADPTFSICPTSYDYDAPITEAGDVNEKYLAIRNVIAKHSGQAPGPVPQNSSKCAYGNVQMEKLGTVVDLLDKLSPKGVNSVYPLSQEQIGQNYGFTMYRHVITKTFADQPLQITGIRDRGHVLLDQQPLGIIDRNGATELTVPLATQGQFLDIIVENQGRINFGSHIDCQRKGIISNVTLGGTTLAKWEMYPLNLESLGSDESFLNQLRYRPYEEARGGFMAPTIFHGTFQTPDKPGYPLDTFIKLDGWLKGQVIINGFNVGRYWPYRGPQVTLYVPSGALNAYPQQNHVMVLELEGAPCFDDSAKCVVEFVDVPILNGPNALTLTPDVTHSGPWGRLGRV